MTAAASAQWRGSLSFRRFLFTSTESRGFFFMPSLSTLIIITRHSRKCSRSIVEIIAESVVDYTAKIFNRMCSRFGKRC